MTPEPCQCTGPGFCIRHQFHKTQREWELCQTSEQFRQIWDSGDSPQHRRERGGYEPGKLSVPMVAAPIDFPCSHRREQIGIVECKICGGVRRLPLFRCDVHGTCTINAHGKPSIEEPAHVCIVCDERDKPKLIFQNDQCPGDIAVMTAAIKALHDQHPDKFITDIRTPCPALWENNPNIAHIDNGTGRPINLEYNGIQQCAQQPIHFLQAFCDDIAQHLEIPRLVPKDWSQPSILLSDEEKSWYSQVREVTGNDKPFWLVNAGIKSDYTAKKWNGWQRVIDLTPDIQWVQVGSSEHRHPKLAGVVDLLGKTDLRQLVRLVYHSQGVLCGNTALMHLAHWVERGPNNPRRRHAVIVAGGREPVSWFAYPGHQIFHTIGELDCCASSGCWKSRVLPEGDGDKKDDELCSNPVGDQGYCMATILPESVAEAVYRFV